ncbi:MAG: hypothetical protein HYV47_03045 [Candidatus Nealsonbacteria bacterium]|nr:hypothetical protein [Candidatus Nealsonbacteria bacterium]
MTPEELLEIFKKCWSKETAGDPWGWKQENPAWTQCVVSALVAQDLLGGDIIMGRANIEPLHVIEPHYWNLLPDSREIDFTKEQFPNGTVISKIEIVKNIEKIRSRLPSAVKKRYILLKMAVENQIKCAAS